MFNKSRENSAEILPLSNTMLTKEDFTNVNSLIQQEIYACHQITSPTLFGISTPGRPIYEGGYDDTTIADAVKDDSIPDKNFKVVGRRGGHSVVLDDGDIAGKDQLMRFRTSSGHMIMMNDSIQSLFIIHANGQSYIELGREGTIDMYSTNSVNIRTICGSLIICIILKSK